MAGFFSKVLGGLGFGPKVEDPRPMADGELEVVRLGKRILFITNSRGKKFAVPLLEQRSKLFYVERTSKHYLLLEVEGNDCKPGSRQVLVRNLETFNTETIEVTLSFLNNLDAK